MFRSNFTRFISHGFGTVSLLHYLYSLILFLVVYFPRCYSAFGRALLLSFLLSRTLSLLRVHSDGLVLVFWDSEARKTAEAFITYLWLYFAPSRGRGVYVLQVWLMNCILGIYTLGNVRFIPAQGMRTANFFR
jgi:hypothetical protein